MLNAVVYLTPPTFKFTISGNDVVEMLPLFDDAFREALLLPIGGKPWLLLRGVERRDPPGDSER